MYVKVVACSVAVLFAFAAPAEALLGGGGGKKGGSKSSSSSSSSKSSSKSSRSRGGVSVGASIGGARAGASIGGGRGISAGASVGGVSAGASATRSGVSATASAGSTSLSASVSSSGVALSTQSAPPQSNAAAFAASASLSLLPWRLLPMSAAGCNTSDECEMLTGRAAAIGTPERLDSDGNIPVTIVEACQRAASAAAQTYGALKVEAASAGRIKPAGQGGVTAPVNLRITYALATGGTQVRQAEVSCAVGGNGQVVALK